MKSYFVLSVVIIVTQQCEGHGILGGLLAGAKEIRSKVHGVVHGAAQGFNVNFQAHAHSAGGGHQYQQVGQPNYIPPNNGGYNQQGHRPQSPVPQNNQEADTIIVVIEEETVDNQGPPKRPPHGHGHHHHHHRPQNPGYEGTPQNNGNGYGNYNEKPNVNSYGNNKPNDYQFPNQNNHGDYKPNGNQNLYNSGNSNYGTPNNYGNPDTNNYGNQNSYNNGNPNTDSYGNPITNSYGPRPNNNQNNYGNNQNEVTNLPFGVSTTQPELKPDYGTVYDPTKENDKKPTDHSPNANGNDNHDKLTTTTTKKPEDDDSPFFVPLSPNQYVYGGDKIEINAPKRETNGDSIPAEDDDELYPIDVRFGKNKPAS